MSIPPNVRRVPAPATLPRPRPRGRRAFALQAAVVLLAACGGSPLGRVPTEPSDPGSPSGLAVVPDHGPVAGGTEVTLVLQGAPDPGPAPLVLFGSRAVPGSVAADGAIGAVAPPGDAAGDVDVRVLLPSPDPGPSARFTYDPPAPGLAFRPAEALPGTAVLVDLLHHVPVALSPTVVFGTTASPSTLRLGPTTLEALVPDGLAPGPLPVQVHDGSWILAKGFTVGEPPRPGDLVVNEFLANPGTLDANRDRLVDAAGDEFVEVVSLSHRVLDLTGCVLRDATSVRHRFPNPTTLPPRGGIVVFGCGNPWGFPLRHDCGHAQTASTGGLGLNNTAETIEIRDPSDAAVLFRLTYTGADVDAGESRTLHPDASAVASPAGGGAYTSHSTVPGSVGNASPGTKADGAAFAGPGAS